MIRALLALYFLVAVLIFWMHTQMPVTLGLALMRSAVWPVWIMTGRPQGQRLPMD